VEPEVLMDGNFPAEITSLVTERVLSSVVKALLDHHVFLEGLILKPNMVRSGSDSSVQIGAKEITYLTLRTLQRTVPVALPGIAFLSGGLSEEDASLALSEINKSAGHKPWWPSPLPPPPSPPPHLDSGNCHSHLGELSSNPVSMPGSGETRTPPLHKLR
jgi:fructose-bisphosphate aldolase class 1